MISQLDIVLALEWRWIALFFSLLLTLIHAIEEVYGEGGPLWGYFGDLVDVKVPAWLGATAVVVLLPLTLAVLACNGYGSACVTCLSLLAGAKLGDAIFSHWMPDLIRRLLENTPPPRELSDLRVELILPRRPNPGIYSSFLAAAEAFLVIGLLGVEVLPAIAAGLVFALVLPGLWLVGRWQR